MDEARAIGGWGGGSGRRAEAPWLDGGWGEAEVAVARVEVAVEVVGEVEEVRAWEANGGVATGWARVEATAMAWSEVGW